MSTERPQRGHSEHGPELRGRTPSPSELRRSYTRFIKQLSQTEAVSHLGLVGYRDDNNYARLDVYALAKRPVDSHDEIQGEGLLGALDALNAFASSVSPGLFVNHYLVDPSRYTLQELEERLKAECSNGNHKDFLGLEPLTSLYKPKANSGNRGE